MIKVLVAIPRGNLKWHWQGYNVRRMRTSSIGLGETFTRTRSVALRRGNVINEHKSNLLKHCLVITNAENCLAWEKKDIGITYLQRGFLKGFSKSMVLLNRHSLFVCRCTCHLYITHGIISGIRELSFGTWDRDIKGLTGWKQPCVGDSGGVFVVHKV